MLSLVLGKKSPLIDSVIVSVIITVNLERGIKQPPRGSYSGLCSYW